MRFRAVTILFVGIAICGAGFGYDYVNSVFLSRAAVTASAGPEPVGKQRAEPTGQERQADVAAELQKRLASVTASSKAAAAAKNAADAERAAVAAATMAKNADDGFKVSGRVAYDGSPTSRALAEETRFLQGLTDRLRSAKYAFNYPAEMYLTRRSQITLTLAVSEDAALKELEKQFGNEIEGKAVTGTTKYAPVMTATLGGRDFKIEPAASQRKAVLLNGNVPTQWTWYVEPLQTGRDKILVLELAANFQHLSATLPSLSVQTFQARIHVQVGTFDLFVQEARRMTPIAQALSGVGAFLTIFGFFGTARNWLAARRQPRSPKNTGT